MTKQTTIVEDSAQPAQMSESMFSDFAAVQMYSCLPLKRQSQQQQTTIFYSFIFSEKTSFDISCESSAKQTIHMMCQDLLSLKNKKKKFRMSSVTNFAWRFKS